ncbi:MAG: type 2 lanthipeptide synthetase LanM, partial [Terracidiphilus sp.]
MNHQAPSVARGFFSELLETMLYSSLLHQAIGTGGPQSAPSSLLSERIRKAWLQALGSLEPEKLDRRLRWDDLGPTKLNAILNDAEGNFSKPSLDESAYPTGTPWILALEKICEAIQASEDRPPQEPGDDTCSERSQLPFCDLWQPAIEWAVQELRRRMGSLLDVQPRDRIFNDLGHHLLARFCFVGEHALLELFNAERGAGAVVLEYFRSKEDGSSPPAREHYQGFIERQRRDGLASLLREFPVLGRMLGSVLVFWFESSSEMLLRVHRDRNLLREAFDIPTDASLDLIQQSLSDHHRGGRTVAILTFASHVNSRKVVYKPRDMGVDEAYQQALVDLNNNSILPPFKTLKILARQDYGYMEFVQHRLCRDEQETERFYYNAGRLSAVLHILGCTDCHHENLIADGDQLVLIDTETLLEPTAANHIENASKSRSSRRLSDLQKKFDNSILRSGLIPSWTLVGAEKHAIDMSALGIDPPADEHELVGGWLAVNSDGMLRGRVKAPATLPTSLPVGIGNANPLPQHIKHFLEGFKDQSVNLVRRRGEWLGPGGIFDRFAGLPRRIVLRATRVYLSIQIQQLQAEALRSELSQGMRLEQLARLFLTAETRPKNWPVFAAEMRHMEQLDIPYFVHQTDGSQLPLQN